MNFWPLNTLRRTRIKAQMDHDDKALAFFQEVGGLPSTSEGQTYINRPYPRTFRSGTYS